MKRIFLLNVCLLLVVAGIHAAHWTVDVHAYQYDMTAYVFVGIGPQDKYEVAAFCGDECRGVGTLLTAADGTQVFQLRIRSNEASGETISFRIYNTATAKEGYAQESIVFLSQSMEGTPGSPIVLTLKGDVNGDGEITAQDASLVLQLVAKKISVDAEGIVYVAADVNGGGVDAHDASLVLQHVAKKIDLNEIETTE